MNSLKHLLCPIHNNKTCLSKPGLRMMKIVTENSTGQFITNCMRQHFNAKFDTAYYKLRHVLQSSTRLITNCDRYYKVQHGLLHIAKGIKKSDTAYYKLRWYLYIIHFKVLKHISNHFNFLLQTINELDKLCTKTDMYIYYFRIPHNTLCFFSNFA